ncbi:hypothetical protein PV433_02780 [Paenibacillus sp. GYB004]|uniref:hypothetical protein n=1 Tax=Paenibacillus sp. GYB004 TaxID=2994393 RepID=UPI002F9633D4
MEGIPLLTILKFAATFPLFLVSLVVCWRMLHKERYINYIWLSFLVPAILQFVLVWISKEGSELWLKVFMGIHIAFTVFAAFIVWFLRQLARAYKN